MRNPRALRNAAVISFCLAAAFLFILTFFFPPGRVSQVEADTASWTRHPLLGSITDTPAIAITTASATTGITPIAGASSVQIQWLFGTVAGSYGTCTVQAYTTYDGVNWLTLGSAASVTATTGTLNAWTLLAQAPTTSVITGAVSSSAALGFGMEMKYTFSCSSYGTGAPVTIKAFYK